MRLCICFSEHNENCDHVLLTVCCVYQGMHYPKSDKIWWYIAQVLCELPLLRTLARRLKYDIIVYDNTSNIQCNSFTFPDSSNLIASLDVS